MIDDLAGPGQFAIAAAFRRQIHDHRTAAHVFDEFAADDARRRTAGDGRCGDDHVGLGDVLAQDLLLPGLFLVGQFAGIAAAAFGLHLGVDETRAPSDSTCSLTAARTS